MGTRRPIICTLCKNDKQSFLFKELNDDEYDLISERYNVERSAYFCMLCIKQIRRKIERRKKAEEQLLAAKREASAFENEPSYESIEEKMQEHQALADTSDNNQWPVCVCV